MKERLAAIQPDHLAVPAHAARELNGGVAETTADIENLVALFDRQRRKNSFAVVGQPVDQDVFVFNEFRNKDVVPEIHILGTLHVRFDGAHGLSSPISIDRTTRSPMLRRFRL